ncbi:TIGR02757 family protein [Bacteroidia bacterium]|nr:TIGR02757 family protein [Bacteroidia bacterium]GHU13416.1 TIGR02757 family protein [Betaproteobacteria bacterium]
MTSLKDYLDEQTVLINTSAFIADDPVQFPRRYSKLQDIEITAFVIATITWGNRKMILKSAERLLSKMGDSPYGFVMNDGWKTLEEANIHRTFFEPDLAWMLRGFKHILERSESLESFLNAKLSDKTSMNAWDIAEILYTEMLQANAGIPNSKCFPSRHDQSALKRINLALRWLVRNDGIVDLGVWTSISPSQLYIPLDIHVGSTARQLGLLTRKANDRKAVEELTAQLRHFCPEDPIKYDFALFGIGINSKNFFSHGCYFNYYIRTNMTIIFAYVTIVFT